MSVTGFLIGFVVGYILCKFFLSKREDGTMVVDNSDMFHVHWTLIYDGDPEQLPLKKRVIFRVKHQKPV